MPSVKLQPMFHDIFLNEEKDIWNVEQKKNIRDIFKKVHFIKINVRQHYR